MANKVIIRSRYDGIEDRGFIDFSKEEKLTKDSFKDECDINLIMERYAQTGAVPGARGPGQYGDFSSVPDYQSALERVRVAQGIFNSLDAEVRLECMNDPAVFLEKVKDYDWAVKHGLAVPKEQVPAPSSPEASTGA